MKVAFLNTYGQSGLSSQKLLELENFIEYNRLDIVCLQETDIQENTFSGCSILNRFIPIINNSKSGYGTCTLCTVGTLSQSLKSAPANTCRIWS